MRKSLGKIIKQLFSWRSAVVLIVLVTLAVVPMLVLAEEDERDRISVFVAYLSALGSLLVAFLTIRLLGETIALRRVETDPELAIYIEARKGNLWIIEIVLRNVGRGAAHNVTFSVDPDKELWREFRITSMQLYREGLSYMAPGQEIRSTLGTYNELTKEPFVITTRYSSGDKEKRQFEVPFTLNPGMFDGGFTIGSDNATELVHEVKKIAQQMERIGQGRAVIEVGTHPSTRRVRKRSGLEYQLRRLVVPYVDRKALQRHGDTTYRLPVTWKAINLILRALNRPELKPHRKTLGSFEDY